MIKSKVTSSHMGGNVNKGSQRPNIAVITNQKKQESTLRKPVLSAEYNEDDKKRLRASLAEVERMRLYVKRELVLARNIRRTAEIYQQESETKARSQAQLLILQARLETQREIAELKQTTSEEIQKVLADIRMIRITAQEELETQRKFTNAARTKALSVSHQKEKHTPQKETANV